MFASQSPANVHRQAKRAACAALRMTLLAALALRYDDAGISHRT